MTLDEVFAEALRQEFSNRDPDTDEPIDPEGRYRWSAEAILRRKDMREALVMAVGDGLRLPIQLGTDNEGVARDIVARMLGEES